MATTSEDNPEKSFIQPFELTSECEVGKTDDLSPEERQLRAQGHVGELPRHFSLLSAISLAWCTTQSWVGYSAVFAVPLLAGGGPSTLFGFILSGIVCGIITTGMAELASAFPSSGGQYHFTYMVSDRRTRPFLSYFVGWMSVFAWWMTASSSHIFSAVVILNVASSLSPGYVPTQWQVYLLYVLFVVLATALISVYPHLMPKLETGFFFLSIIAFPVFVVAVLARSSPKLPATTVFTEWTNYTGWPDGFAFFLGVGQSMWAFLGTDSTTHVAEEMPNPSKKIPIAMANTVLLGMFTGVVWVIAFLFSCSDLAAVSTAAVPILEVYTQALRSKEFAAFFAIWLMLANLGGGVACFVTSGRLAWAFARDGGMPFSSFFSKTHPTLKMPLNATLLTAGFCIFYGLIYIGSTTAFNSFIALSILGLNITYVVPQAVVLVRGRQKVFPDRSLRLGNMLGTFCNVFSVLWILLFTILFCFPDFLPATAQNMNYVSVVFVGVIVFIGITWAGWKRKTFTGPNIVLNH